MEKRTSLPGRTGWSTRRIVGVSFGVALTVAGVGIASTSVWLSSARDPNCHDSDCDMGVALLAMFFGVVSLVVGAVCGAVTGGVLAVRRQPAARRGPTMRRVSIAAALPLGAVLLFLYATT